MKKADKIRYGDHIHPGSAESSMPEMIGTRGSFVDDAFSQALDKYKAKLPAGGLVEGKVVRVIKNGKLEPLGMRAKNQATAEIESTTCLKLIVYCPEFDQGKMLPENWVNPASDWDLVSNLCVFEAQNEEIDKQVPGLGDTVNVIYPWYTAGGWTSKVGIYLGKVAPGFAVTHKSTKSHFDKIKGNNEEDCDGRKQVPQEVPTEGQGA